MKIDVKQTPREFSVGEKNHITIKDCGSVCLDDNEQVTFLTKEGAEYDFVRKSWGYYATPSVNDRLKRFGFKTALVKNVKGQIYIMVAEATKVEEFKHYLSVNNNEVVQWLDELDGNDMQALPVTVTCPVCFSKKIQVIKEYDAPPKDENDFQLEPYHRVLKKCLDCKHCFNVHDYDIEIFYGGKYVESVYKNELKSMFEKIINLPDEKSDNAHRVRRVERWMNEVKDTTQKVPNVMDIGSGLCVFPYKLKQVTGWNCVALDPDPLQAKHAQDTCDIECVNLSVMDYNCDRDLDLITMNKILEHFVNPEEVLQKVKTFFPKGKVGYVYIEVPDAEPALKASPDREEFFIEHFHGFSFSSLQKLLERTRYNIINIKRIVEPSGKYTLCCFASTEEY